MKKLFLTLMCLVACTVAQASGIDTDTLISSSVTKQKEIENGGDGIYRSIVVTDKSLSDFTIYRPRDVKWASQHEGRLPLLIWANGACGDDNSGYQNMLNHLASHGYVVIALGKMRLNDNDPTGGANGQQHVAEAINWMVKQVSNTKSDYYRAVNVNNIALSGHSCGGAEAIANCANTRVKTLLIMNAGMGGMSMGGASPQTLKSLHCPIIYLTGGPDDVAYANAQGDFNSITKVPVVWADLSTAGHGGTYWHQRGGDFARIALKWMDWHLKGKTQNAPIFLKPDYEDFKGWLFKNKNFKQTDYESAYDAGTTIGDTVFVRDDIAGSFALGADVSHTTQLEAGGRIYNNRKGKKADLLNVLKEEGMNAVRLRVWVNPRESWSTKADVQKVCTRAKKLGMDIMIDFHYSDFWANGGNQFKPAKWEGHTVDALVDDVYNHTFDVLNTLKKAGITVKWAQIGNDVENGMLWGDGRIGKENFARFLSSAYSAVKAVSPDTKAVIHVASGQDQEALTSFFDRLKGQSVEWDAIGLSAFPKWAGLSTGELISKTTASVKALKERYGKEVMIVETGHYNNRPLESNNFLCDFIDSLVVAGATGLFYWEPEVVKDYELGAWNPITDQASIALDAFNGIRHAEVPYTMTLRWQMPADSICNDLQHISIPVEADHIRNRVASIDLIDGKDVVASTTQPTDIFSWKTEEKGVHALYAKATSTDALTAITDTCYMVVGPLTVLDPCEVEDATKELAWNCTLQAPGDYMIVLKYKAGETLSAKLNVDDTRIATQRFTGTAEGKFGYATRVYTADDFESASADEPASAHTKDIRISLTPSSTKLGLPEVLSLMVIPMSGQPMPQGGSIIDHLAQIKNHMEQGCHIRKVGQQLFIEAPEDIREVRLYTTAGQLLQSVPGQQSSLTLPCPNVKGTIIVSVHTESGTYNLHYICQ